MKTRWTVLVAEDNEDDVLILEHVFSRIKGNVALKFTRDGEEAVEYLAGANGFGNRRQFPFPDVLLLDLKMPKLDGFGVLEWLRRNPPLHRLRVIIFSSSSQRADIDRAYDLGASSFFRKPTALDEMKNIVDCFMEWLEVNQFPILADTIYPGKDSGQDAGDN